MMEHYTILKNYVTNSVKKGLLKNYVINSVKKINNIHNNLATLLKKVWKGSIAKHYVLEKVFRSTGIDIQTEQLTHHCDLKYPSYYEYC